MSKIYEKKWFTPLISVVATILVCTIFFLFILPLFEKEEDENFFELHYKERVHRFEVENEMFKKYGIDVDIAFIGDSITHGFENEKSYYEKDYTVAWRGISGDNTFYMEDRLKVSLYDIKPKLIVMCIGANNLSSMLENYSDILDGIKNNLPNTKLIVHSIYPTSGDFADRNAVIPGLNSELRVLVESYGYTFIDTHSMVKNEKGEFSSEYTDDGLHPNLNGYKKIAEILKPAIDSALKK